MLEAAAIAENRSEHPLARAILERFGGAPGALPPADAFTYVPGKGIVCSAGGASIIVGSRSFLAEKKIDTDGCPRTEDHVSEVLVARAGRLLGALHLADVPRPEAVSAVAALRSMGLRTVLLTGDSAPVARAIGRHLGVDEVVAELLPHHKAAHVEAMLRLGHKVAMVGDGINDAPALTRATVGIAMGSGTEVARESANIVLIGNHLGKFVETIALARRCRRIIRQNFVGTLVVDGVGVLLAAVGLLNPLLAAFIHVSSELTFILNATRLLPRGGDRPATAGAGGKRSAPR